MTASVSRCPRVVLLLVALALGAGAVRASAGDLDAAQSKTLASLVAAAERIETNVRLAEEAAGPGTGRPSESKVRLAKTRLASPVAHLAEVRGMLAALPADHADVVALGRRLDAVGARITALTARLDGAPGAPAPTAPAGTKLDYRQEKELADARFYAREVEGLATALEALAAEVDAAADKDAFDHRRLRDGVATADKARERAQLARTRLDALPADGAGVRDVVEQLAKATAVLDRAEPRVRPVSTRVEGLIDPAAHPSFPTDLRRVQDLARRFSEPATLFARPRRAAEVVTDAPAAVEEHARFVAAYRLLVLQGTREGEQAAGASRYFEESHRAFAAAAAEAKSGMPRAIDEAVAAAVALAEQAAAEGKPAFFLEGVPQRVAQVEDLVVLQTALDAAAGAASARRLEALRADVAQRRDRLRAQIIATNDPPPDRYRGDDRAALLEAATAAWKKARPDVEVVGVRIPSPTWERDVLWRRQGRTWYLIDRSHLQAIVLVRHGPDLVAMQPVDLWRDHLKDGALTATLLFDPAAEPAPEHLLPAAKAR